jgi:hypothetical protein
MATTIYREQEGQRLPSVSTIVGRFKDSGGLIRWAYHCGRDGLDLNDARERAPDAGTLAQAMVAAHLHGRRWRPATRIDPGLLAKARSGFNAYLSWERTFRPAIRHIDVALASSRYRYGGTLDAVGVCEGQLALLDWKASNAVYQDHLIQLAACKALWDETYPDQPITGGFHLCRFSKETGDFAHHFYARLDAAWKQFRLFRRAYDIDALLRKRAAAHISTSPKGQRTSTAPEAGMLKVVRRKSKSRPASQVTA